MTLLPASRVVEDATTFTLMGFGGSAQPERETPTKRAMPASDAASREFARRKWSFEKAVRQESRCFDDPDIGSVLGSACSMFPLLDLPKLAPHAEARGMNRRRAALHQLSQADRPANRRWERGLAHISCRTRTSQNCVGWLPPKTKNANQATRMYEATGKNQRQCELSHGCVTDINNRPDFARFAVRKRC